MEKITKKCSLCKKEKNITEFHKYKKAKDGLYSHCKFCKSERRKLIYKNNKEFRINSLLRAKNRYKNNIKYEKQRQRERYIKNRDKIKKQARDYATNNPNKILFISAKRRAKLNNIPFNIELTDVIVPEKCPILRVDIKKNKTKIGYNSPSLDRIIPSLGYTKNNIRVISHKANRMKSDITLEVALQLVKYLKGEL